MEKTVDHGNISVDELDFKLVLVFHCTHDEERERVRQNEREKRQKQKQKQRERKRQKGKERERQEKKQRMMLSLTENFCAYIKGLQVPCVGDKNDPEIVRK